MDAHTAHTEPLHQYANVASPAQQTAPMYNQQPFAQNPQYVQQTPVAYSANATPVTNTVVSQAISAGTFGLIVVGAGTMGANLHRVQDGEMSMGDAVANSLAKGAAGGVAAAGATAAATSFTSGGALGLAVTLAVGTGISYLLSK